MLNYRKNGLEGLGMGESVSWYISLCGLIFQLYKCSTYSKQEIQKDEEKQTLKLN